MIDLLDLTIGDRVHWPLLDWLVVVLKFQWGQLGDIGQDTWGLHTLCL